MKISNIKYKISESQTKIQNFGFCIVLLIFSFCILHFLTGCGSGKKERAVEQNESVPVKVMKVELKTIQNTLDYVGDIKAQDEALVYPKVSGKIIEKLKIEGEAVKKGEAVVYIDRDEVGFKFEKAPVESPLNGFIGRINVDIGTQVSAQTPVALVVDMDKVKIKLDIPENYLPKISVGQIANIMVQPYGDEKFSGVVSRISPVLDLETRSAPIEIIISNPEHHLKSGMFAKVELIIEEHKDTPVIIKEALLGRPPNEYVYVVDGDIAHARNVKLGIHYGAYYEVAEGLKENDLVVIMGQQKLRDGAPVSIEIEDNRGEGK